MPLAPPDSATKNSAGKYFAAGFCGGAYCAAAALIWFFWAEATYGDRGDGFVAIFGLVFATPGMALVGIVLGLMCFRQALYRLGPAGPAALAAVLGGIGIGLIRNNTSDLALMGVALVLGIVGHYAFVGLSLLLGKRWKIHWLRDLVVLAVVVLLALLWSWASASSAQQRIDDAAARADDVASLAGFGDLQARQSQRITLSRDCPEPRTRYSYEYEGASSNDLRAGAEDVALRYEAAGFEVQRWVQIIGNETIEDATYVIYGIEDGAGVKAFVNDGRVAIEVSIDCGSPFSLDRADWRDFVVDVFPDR